MGGYLGSELGALTSAASNAQEVGGRAPPARDAVRVLRPSQIREVANAGFGVPDVLPFWFGESVWFGESGQVTPQFIRDATSRALADGATFLPTIWASPRCEKRLRITSSASCMALPGLLKLS